MAIKNTLIANIYLLQNIIDLLYRSNFRIVYYHMIRDQPPAAYFPQVTKPSVFREQIRMIKKRYEIIPLPEAVARAERGESLHRTLSITTDDGFAENYSVLAPILAEEQVTATIFLINDCIDNRQLMWRNKLMCVERQAGKADCHRLMNRLADEFRLPRPLLSDNLLTWSYRTWEMREKDMLADRVWELANMMPLAEWLDENRPYLTMKQIREMLGGGFHFGSHTKTHPYCSKLAYGELEDEIVGSIADLSLRLGREINLFAYPFGHRAAPRLEQQLIRSHDDKVKGLFGIQYQLQNRNNPYVWERDPMEGAFGKTMLKFVFGPLKRRWMGQLF